MFQAAKAFSDTVIMAIRVHVLWGMRRSIGVALIIALVGYVAATLAVNVTHIFIVTRRSSSFSHRAR